mmetsp:Transcript_3293/g.5310  ORF Transcript_3293/g.5310 Transcript_3293/m.5310 type:complete len:110 (-) Transcript_3293:59-388(-)
MAIDEMSSSRSSDPSTSSSSNPSRSSELRALISFSGKSEAEESWTSSKRRSTPRFAIPCPPRRINYPVPQFRNTSHGPGTNLDQNSKTEAEELRTTETLRNQRAEELRS